MLWWVNKPSQLTDWLARSTCCDKLICQNKSTYKSPWYVSSTRQLAHLVRSWSFKKQVIKFTTTSYNYCISGLIWTWNNNLHDSQLLTIRDSIQWPKIYLELTRICCRPTYLKCSCEGPNGEPCVATSKYANKGSAFKYMVLGLWKNVERLLRSKNRSSISLSLIQDSIWYIKVLPKLLPRLLSCIA